MKDILKYIALLVAVALVAACDKVPLLAPSGSVIALSANALVIPAGGTVGLTAFVTESSGTPVQNGTTVRFTTTLGTVSPSEVQTSNGVAVATFQAGSASGVAEVRAVSGGAAGTGTTTGTNVTAATNVVQITIGAAAVTSVAVRANPGSVPAVGGNVEIIATALGGASTANLPIANVAVSFSTTAGTLSASTAVTDSNGEARVQLNTTRKATVTAAVGAQSKTVDVNVTAAPSLTLSVGGPASPTVGQSIVLTVTPAADTAPSVVINWGDGTNTGLGVIKSAQSASHAYRNAGNYGIMVTGTEDGSSASASASVTIGPAPSVAITASPTNGPKTTVFSFTVTPATANGVKDVTVNFNDGTDATDLGAVTTATTVTHQFPDPKSYNVTATQTDGNGNTTNAVVVITVTP